MRAIVLGLGCLGSCASRGPANVQPNTTADRTGGATDTVPRWRTESGRLEAWRELAQWYIDNGLAVEAQRMVDSLHEAGERGPELDVIQARAMLAQKLPSEALHLLQSTVKQAPQFAAAWDALGVAHVDLDDLDAAVSAFERALKLDAERTVTRNNLAFVLLALGRCDTAVEHLERVVVEQSSNARYRNNLAFALVCAGQHRRALDLFRSMSGEADARYNLGVAYERLDKLPSAVLQYQQALEVDPEHEAASAALARLAPDPDLPIVPIGELR